ncbi:hypothetical protein GCM10027275_34600 [Rhabdobacter roseus]|uniref:Uncharacterized protein YicC (UPF0701 family) n=1 Tax=Rhabdobacter roseus TaxID=1655419 RepID=A0A840TYP7_9BACT|nr:YtxH domain-containing protein [Rhabdobacter roseus]MBB5285318.1 uncharacterized protein YicC (UPF0701 family) [Rhabdobacter roseus]
MSVNAKHLATFILGAAAGVALQKYFQTEEGEKLVENLKAKAEGLRTEATEAAEKAPEYFAQLKTKGAEALKENFPDIEKILNDLMEKFAGATQPASDAPPTASAGSPSAGTPAGDSPLV